MSESGSLLKRNKSTFRFSLMPFKSFSGWNPIIYSEKRLNFHNVIIFKFTFPFFSMRQKEFSKLATNGSLSLNYRVENVPQKAETLSKFLIKPFHFRHIQRHQ